MTDYDNTEKVERTETGFEATVSSTRGTGTRDQDTVKMKMKTEEFPDESETAQLVQTVQWMMDKQREHQPDKKIQK